MSLCYNSILKKFWQFFFSILGLEGCIERKKVDKIIATVNILSILVYVTSYLTAFRHRLDIFFPTKIMNMQDFLTHFLTWKVLSVNWKTYAYI